jgi:methionyl-tRNA synthetase
LVVHGWWNIAGAKMSKSTGNIVDPNALADKYGIEAVRYYLMSDMATGRDANFSEYLLIQRYNNDLANSLGNLLNRTLNMAAKYRSGIIKRWDSVDSPAGGVPFKSWEVKRKAVIGTNMASAMYDVFEISEVVRHAYAISVKCNVFVEETAPWKLFKSPELEDTAALDAVLYCLAESLRIIAILISPVLPKAAAGIFAQLNWNGPMTLSEAEWGKLPDGHQLGQPKPLFPRIEAAT